MLRPAGQVPHLKCHRKIRTGQPGVGVTKCGMSCVFIQYFPISGLPSLEIMSIADIGKINLIHYIGI